MRYLLILWPQKKNKSKARKIRKEPSEDWLFSFVMFFYRAPHSNAGKREEQNKIIL